MGNCIAKKATIVDDDEQESKRTEKTEALGHITSTLQAAKHNDGRKKESRRVRFGLNEEVANVEGNLSETKSGMVRRIRFVLTQKELDHILNDENKYSSAEKLLKAINMRSNGISISRSSNDGERAGNRRPALESIPEDH